MAAAAMIAVGMKLDTYKPVEAGPRYLEVLREHEERAAVELAAAFEDQMWSTPTKINVPWSIFNHDTGKFENISTAKAKLL